MYVYMQKGRTINQKLRDSRRDSVAYAIWTPGELLQFFCPFELHFIFLFFLSQKVRYQFWYLVEKYYQTTRRKKIYVVIVSYWKPWEDNAMQRWHIHRIGYTCPYPHLVDRITLRPLLTVDLFEVLRHLIMRPNWLAFPQKWQ